jgi:hypothetical protein
MKKQLGRPSSLSLMRILAILAFLVQPVLAHSQQSQPPDGQAQSPESQLSQAQDSKLENPQPQSDKSKPAKDDPSQKKSDDQVGKSKLERETGTVNDRIFEVLPNYGTVETANAIPPLTAGQKFRIATASVFDWGAYPFNGALAAIAQAKNDPKEWGQGWGAYGKRYGANFADNSIGTYMTVAIFPSLLHEDPRYYQMAKGSFARRAYHGINRLFVTRTDSGGERFNISESLGNAVAAASQISTTYRAIARPRAMRPRLDS